MTPPQGIKALFKALAIAVLLSTFLLPQDQQDPDENFHGVKTDLPNDTGERAPRSLALVSRTGENQKQ